MTPAKHALLIGVGDSPRIRKHPSSAIRRQYRILRCCDGDVDVMRELLVERFGFDHGNVEVLKTREATQQAILDGVDALVERVGRGDAAVIYYCGHGSRMRDPYDPEALLETLVPYDTSRGPQENRDIPDLEIVRWVERLNRATPHVTLIFDCCHSGSMGRPGFGGAVQEAPADLRPADEIFAGGPVPRLFARSRAATREPRLRSGWLPAGRRAVTIAACRAHEHSWELKLEDGAGYCYHGALSFHLARALCDLGDVTWRDALERVVPRVTADRPSQHPQLEGDIDQPAFGFPSQAQEGKGSPLTEGADRRSGPARPRSYLSVVAGDGDGVLLWGGRAQGVAPNSSWTIRPHGTRHRWQGEELARVRVEQVAGTTARCRVAAGSADRLTGGERAFLVEEGLPSPVLAVAVDAPEERRQSLAEWLGEPGTPQRGLLTVTAESALADALVHWLEPRGSVDEDDPCPFLGPLEEGAWVVVGEDGCLASRPRGELGELVEDLVRLARCRGLRRLRNPDADSRLRDRVDLRLLDAAGEPIAVDPEYGMAVVAEGRHVDFELENRHDEDVWVSLVELDSDHAVTVVLPRRGHPTYRPGGLRLAAGETLRVGRDYYGVGAGLEQRLPDGFPWPAPAGATRDVGVSHLRLLVTTIAADFELFEQEGTRSLPTHPLARLAYLYHRNVGTRTVVLPPEDVARDQDWTVVARELAIRRETGDG